MSTGIAAWLFVVLWTVAMACVLIAVYRAYIRPQPPQPIIAQDWDGPVAVWEDEQ